MRILGLSGSLRKGSFNTALLRAAAELCPSGVRLEAHTIAGIPLYDGDLEQREGLPPAVVALKEAISAADGMLIATPEYNGSLPGPLKNALDWCSRPTSDIARVFGGLPTALCGATPGRSGTGYVQTAWLPVLRVLQVRFWPGSLQVPSAHEAFEGGRLVDTALRDRLERFVADFTGFCRDSGGRRPA
jgi:NAD(P)H-dependent FMN reductase